MSGGCLRTALSSFKRFFSIQYFLINSRKILATFLVFSLLFSSPAFAADGSGTNTVDPTTGITNATGQTYTYTYTASEQMDSGKLQLTVPSGWSAPQGTPGTAGYTQATAGSGAAIADTTAELKGEGTFSSGTLTEGAGIWEEDPAQLDSCSTTSTQTLAADTTNFKEGSQSVSCNNSPSVTTPDSGDSFGYVYTSTQDWSSYETFGVWFRSSLDITGTGTLSLIFYTGSLATAATGGTFDVYTLNGSATLSANTWYFLSGSLTGVTRGAIKSWGIEAGGPGGLDSKIIDLDDFMVGNTDAMTPTFAGSGPWTADLKLLDLDNTETITITYGSGGGTSGVTNSTSTGVHTFTTKSQVSANGTLTSISSSPTVTLSNLTTLGDGTDGGNSTIGPGASATEIDRFSLVTNTGTDTVTGMTVTLAPAGAFNNLATVGVYTTGDVLKCESSSWGGDLTVELTSCAISVTTTPTDYVVKITPKTHSNMPAVPGASYATTATVTSITATNTTTGTDTDSATITTDNLSPNNATSTSGSSSVGNVTLDWTSSNSSDFQTSGGSVILRWTGSSPGAEVPAEGSTYTAGNTISTATVACVISSAASASLSKTDGTGGSSGCTTSALTNGQAYSYKAFQLDTNGNYDAGVTFAGSPFTPLLPTTTIATGTDPSTATVAPESGIVNAGKFNFSANTGTDSITALTVILAASGTPYDGLSEASITNNSGSTTYFSAIASPSSNTLNFSGGTPIPVSTSDTPFSIRVTPKTHANMTAVPGTSYDLSPYVSAFTSTNTQSGSDSNSNTLTIDNTSPSGATSTSGSIGNANVTLNWTTSGSSDFSESVILRWTAGTPGAEVPVEGTNYSANDDISTAKVACVISSAASTPLSKINGTGGSSGCTTSALTNGTAYSYKVFQKDSNGNYDAGVTFTGSPFTPNATIIANGTNPSNGTVAPGSSITDLDAFTLITGTGSDSITALTVTLASGTYAGLSEVRVTSDDGSTLYFAAVADPASETVNFSGGTPIPVTTSSTPFKVRITPKTHANMPAVPGSSYAVTGTVTAFTSTNIQSGSDSSSATITVDNTSPNNATSTSGTAGDTAVELNWTTSNSSDFSKSVILRWTAGTPGAEVPVEGTDYTAGDSITTATVACVITSAASTSQTKTDGTGGSSGCNTSALSNGTAYSYKVFQKDSNGNYDAGVTFTGSPFTPALIPKTTLSNGTNPSNSTIAPETSITDLDTFNFSTNSGTDSVTALTVTLASGTYAGLSEVRVTSDDGSTLYFAAVSNPSSETVNFSGGTPIPVTTSSTPFKVRITPKTHANMPAPPGASYATTGTVTAFTSTNVQLGSDSSSATITVDNLAPANASWGTITTGDVQVSLAWTNPGDSDFAEVLILKDTASITDTPTEGQTYSTPGTIGGTEILYIGTGEDYTDNDVVNDTDYFYKIFVRDDYSNYRGSETGPHTPSLNPMTTLGNGTDPGNSTLAPGASNQYLDQFTFITNIDTDSVTALTVTTTATDAIVDMKIWSNDLGTQYFTTVSAPTGNNWDFSGGTPIPVSTASASFRVLVTFEGHGTLAEGSYAVTGNITSFSATNTTSGSDNAGTTLTVDNVPTANVTATSGTAGDSQVSLSWTNPVDGDFSSNIVLRHTSAVSDAPVDGSTYIVGNTIGSATVACVTSGTSCIDSGLSNGTDYHYKIFSLDTHGNYSTGVVPTGSPFTPTFIATITMANGTNPSNDTVAPGSGIVDVDSFAVNTNDTTNNITALIVALSAGTYVGISEVRITSDDGATLYFTAVADPASETVNFSGGTAITATTTPTQYKIRITPKSHSGMPAVPGDEYDTTATVSSFTSTYAQSGSDSSSATVTIDNDSPNEVTSDSGTEGDTEVSLEWNNPGGDFSNVLILRNLAAISDTPVEGASYVVDDVIGSSVVRYISGGESLSDTLLTNGVAYFYKIFTHDDNGNYSAGAEPSGSPFTPESVVSESGGGSSGYVFSAPTPTPIVPSSADCLPTHRFSSVTGKPCPYYSPIPPVTPVPSPAPTPPPVLIPTPLPPPAPTPSITEINPPITADEEPQVSTPEAVIGGPNLFQRITLTSANIGRDLGKKIVDIGQNLNQKIAKLRVFAGSTIKNTSMTFRNIVFFTFKATQNGTLAVLNQTLYSANSVGKQIVLLSKQFFSSGSLFVAKQTDLASRLTKEMIDNSTSAVSETIAEGNKLWHTAVNSTNERLKMAINYFESLPSETIITETPPKANADKVVFRSGSLELVADQNQPVQAIVGFNFQAEVNPSREAENVGGTFKFLDSDSDGIWTADVKMPEVAGEFNINTRIAYKDGESNNLKSTVLIDPEGYVYEQVSRGELRVAGAEVTLWHEKNGDWEIWKAGEYNQINPQITDQTGQYSFLAPAGAYYLEVSAKDYKPYRSDIWNLDIPTPIHQSIKLEYIGE